FDRGAATYARGRPGYPAAIVGWLRDALALVPRARVVDLGAGTGKLVPSLLATGADVVAIEPVAGMRAQFAAAYPQLPVLEGSAEAMPLADASVDAVVCATAFHWFATAAALAEIRRVLKHGGRLGLIWNVRDERVAWVAQLAELVRDYAGDTPRQASDAWRRVFPAEGFGPLQASEFAHAHEGPAETVIVGRLLSTSFVAALPDMAREELAQRIRARIAAEPSLAGRAVVAMPYRTIAYVTQKIA
ncbi:class I SAM-dependent methyltransferase, partial [Tahibacter caeni]|uniref:class I SAM-dependent methyltransferase n=1 Tax=Tahibacter caeni TaxID=1453545 RepID=UPI0021498EAB